MLDEVETIPANHMNKCLNLVYFLESSFFWFVLSVRLRCTFVLSSLPLGETGGLSMAGGGGGGWFLFCK